MKLRPKPPRDTNRPWKDTGVPWHETPEGARSVRLTEAIETAIRAEITEPTRQNIHTAVMAATDAVERIFRRTPEWTFSGSAAGTGEDFSELNWHVRYQNGDPLLQISAG